MSESAEFENRLSAAETRIEDVAADAAAARHLAAAGDRDLADLTIKVVANQRAIEVNQAAINANGTAIHANGTAIHANATAINANGTAINANRAAINANRAAINTLGVQTAERFQHMEARFQDLEAKVDAGFVEVRGKLDQTTAGLAQIIRLLSPGDQN
jgi:chromosome segregation ATPase